MKTLPRSSNPEAALPRRPAPSRIRRRGWSPWALVGLIAALSLAPGPAGVATSHGPQIWTAALADLDAPFSEATAVTALTLSSDGTILLAGLDNGGLLFIDTATGQVVDAAHASDRGAVTRITATADGGRAAAIFADGHLAVIDREQDTPLLALNTGPQGLSSDAQARQAAVFARGGRYLVVTQDQVHLYGLETANGTMRYVLQDSSPEPLGPFVYADPVLALFGALDRHGALAIYTYGADEITLLGEANVDTSKVGDIVALAVSEDTPDGQRVALGHQSGAIRRYQPILSERGSQLKLEYSDDLIGSIRGLQVSPDGQRIAAWSSAEVVWAEGNNNPDFQSPEEVTATRASRVSGPKFLSSTLEEVSFSRDLTRALVRVDGRTTGTHLFNLPEFKGFVVDADEVRFGLSTMNGDGERVYQSAAGVLTGFHITEKELAPPALRQADNDASSAFNLELDTKTVLIGGAVLLVLLLLAILLPLAFAARRQTPEPIAPLDPSGPPLTQTFAGAASAPTPGGFTHPVASQAPLAPAPDGILVLREVTIAGPPTLRGITASWRRPGVALLRGKRPDLDAFCAGLTGGTPMSGLVAVGGATAAETPMLFSRRIHVGLAPAPPSDQTPDASYRAEAARHGLPTSLVERRIGTDLGWLGRRRSGPVRDLGPVDHWKVRLALAVIHRPHVVVLRSEDLPAGVANQPTTADATRQVLRAVAKHFQLLVLLMDDGQVDLDMLRAWADEEARLGPGGISEQVPLKGGHPQPTSAKGGRGRAKA